MKTLVVCIDSKLMNNFCHLPLQYVDKDLNGVEFRVVVIDEGRFTLESDEGKPRLSTNFDLAIWSKGQMQYAQLQGMDISNTKVVALDRPSKAAMRLDIDNQCGHYPGYIPIRTWTIGPWDSGIAHPTSWAGRSRGDYVLKADHGARGAGQVFIPSKYDVTAILKHNLLRNELSPNQTYDQCLEDFKAQFPDVVYSTHGENYAGESLKMISEQGFSLQEHVKDITAEFRILVGADDLYVFTRDFTDSPYRQACVKTREYLEGESAGKLRMSTLPDEIGIPASIRKYLTEAFRTRVGYSVDLFLTKTGWGIFEYCNQFGTEELYGDFIRDFHKGVVKHYLQLKELVD